MKNNESRLREVTTTEPAGPSGKLLARVRDFNALSKHRVTLSESDVESAAQIEADVIAYADDVWRRCNGGEAFTTEMQDLDNVVRQWFTLQTESEEHMIGDVEVSTPALESPTIRGVVFAKGEEIGRLIMAIEAEIVAAARRREANRTAEETALLAYMEEDHVAAHLAEVICEAAAEAQRAEAAYHAAPAQAPVKGAEWFFLEGLVSALQLRFTERKFAGIHASQVAVVLSRARSRKVA